MKNKLLLALALLIALASQPLLGAAEASSEQVVDTSGKKLQTSASYYIIQTVPITKCGRYEKCRSGGGLSLASIGASCPLDVVVVDGYHSLPLVFEPINPKKRRCAKYSNVWKLDSFVSKGKWFVTNGGSVGNLSWETVRNWFKIEKYDGAYKLVYCPSASLSPKHLCKDIGVFVDESGNRRLSLSDVPFKVKFQLA